MLLQSESPRTRFTWFVSSKATKFVITDLESYSRTHMYHYQVPKTTVRKQCLSVQFSSVQLLSHVWLFATPWTAAHQASLSITNSQSPPKPMSIESVMPSSHLILCHPLLLLPPITLSIRIFSNESTLHMRWSKYWSFSFSISPSNEHPELIFRMDWFDLLAVQGSVKSLLQYHKASSFRIWYSSTGNCGKLEFKLKCQFFQQKFSIHQKFCEFHFGF